MKYRSEREWLDCPQRAKVIRELCEKYPKFKELIEKRNPKDKGLSETPLESINDPRGISE